MLVSGTRRFPLVQKTISNSMTIYKFPHVPIYNYNGSFLKYPFVESLHSHSNGILLNDLLLYVDYINVDFVNFESSRWT